MSSAGICLDFLRHAENCFTESTFELTPSPGATRAYVYIDSPLNSKVGSSVVIQDISISKITEISAALVKDNSAPLIENVKIKFVKKNAMAYEVQLYNIKTAVFPLVFSENFSDSWKLFDKNGNVLFDNAHFKANGFMNMWLVDPSVLGGKENVILHLEYTKQKEFEKFYALAISLVVGSSAVIVYLFLLRLVVYRKYEK